MRLNWQFDDPAISRFVGGDLTLENISDGLLAKYSSIVA